MKKLIPTILLIVLMLPGCINDSRARLLRDIKEANRHLPIAYGSDDIFEKIEYDKELNEVFFIFATKNREIITSCISCPEAVKRNISIFLSGEDYRPLLEELVDAKTALTVSYRCLNTGENVSLGFTNEQLIDISKMDLDENQRASSLLKNTIDIYNSQYPVDMGDGMTMTEVIDDGKNVIIVIKIDDPSVDFDVVRDNIGEFKQEYNLKSDPHMASFIELIKPMNRGLTFRYIDANSDKTIDLTYSPEEL